eukprot:1162102-Pelagomonas_calceolata.AAC.7
MSKICVRSSRKCEYIVSQPARLRAEIPPRSIKKNETHWLKRAISHLHHIAGTGRASGGLEGSSC